MYAVLLHAHQKIDRTAYRHLKKIVGGDTFFPTAKQITYFEGNRGPDSTRLKKQKEYEQPWHFINPFDLEDSGLHKLIDDHFDALVKALKESDEVRSAFEASWLAHALVDGLTPAHHYPYESELAELRGDDRHSRKGLIGRIYVKGETASESWRRSIKLIGPKGLLTSHALFEGGAYTIMAPLRLERAVPSSTELSLVCKLGVVEYFQRMAKEVAAYDLYVRFIKEGWTTKLSRDIRRELAPRMVMMVTLAWYAALHEAKMIKEQS
jgi:hypothetical protein